MSEFTSVQKCVLFLVFFYNSGNDAASSNLKLVYFHWFYNNSASSTTRAYNAPANNAKYSVSKKLIIPCGFKQIRCFQPKSMSQLVKNQLVFMTFLKCIRIYNIENDWFSLVLIAFGEIIEIRWFSNVLYFLGNIDTFESDQHRNIENVVISLVRSKKNLARRAAGKTPATAPGTTPAIL